MTMALQSKSAEYEEWGGSSNNLWVGNLSPEVTDADLMDLFSQYGALDSVTTYSSRSYAFVFFKRVEDAKAAKTALQGAPLRGLAIRIEFAKPAKPCKNLWVGGVSLAVTKEELEAEFRKFGNVEEFKFFRDRNTACVEFLNLEDATRAMKVMNGKRLGGDQIRVDFLRSQSTKKDLLVDYGQFQTRTQSHHSMGRDGQPSNILWVRFPPSFQIDEQMLHNAMILFGEMEKIKSFPSRHYALIEFRSVDEARRAKEGLQGRLFNDPRITIMYSSSDQATGQDYPGFYPENKGPVPDGLLNENPFRPLPMDVFGHNRPMVPTPGGTIGPNASMRPFGPQGHDPLISSPKFNEMGALHKFQDGNSKSQMVPNLKRPSPPAPGMHPSSAPGIRPPTRPTSGGWDVFDVNQLQRDSKRPRIDGAFPGSVQLDVDHIWRGRIAKGGTSVCRARCVPIGERIATELPDVIDCAARTGLDMLTKHYADATGFDVVFFLPDSEADFASYTEFLRYLKAKNRAGVVKCGDNTTLFLVPPSDFLTKVLKVTGPERLYGVVLKFPLNPSSTPVQQSMHLPSPSTQYMQHILPTQAEYGSISVKQEQVLPVDYNRLLHEDSKLLPKPLNPAPSGPSSVYSVPPDYPPNNTVSASQAGVTLTPELIATLTSLLPARTQSSSAVAGNTSVDPSTVRPPFPPMAPNDGNQAHLWKQQDHQITDQTNHHPQQFGSSYNVHSAQYHFYPPASTPYHHAQVVSGSDSSHFQDTAASLQQLGTASSKSMPHFTTPSQSGQVAVSPQVGQQYHVEVSAGTQKGYGVVQGTDASVLCSSNPFQQPNNFVASSNQVPSANALQQQTVTPYTVDNVNSEPPNQQHQPAFFGFGQGMSELESDKNQRYQSTLQFANNLLLQIQQQQPQGGHGPGNQQ